ncbi:hypothetical protein SERLADRAFT_469544, partial [Serpula lacrymans var. lacrymans S7.9]
NGSYACIVQCDQLLVAIGRYVVTGFGYYIAYGTRHIYSVVSKQQYRNVIKLDHELSSGIEKAAT